LAGLAAGRPVPGGEEPAGLGESAAVSVPPNGFLPREAHFAELDGLLRRGRLITLIGPPGVGKSRLLAEYLVGRELETSGFVDLTRAAAGADVSAALVAAAAAARSRHELLVLDGCDHVIDACARTVSALLRADPCLKVLATSREAFRIAGESLCPVPLLSRDEAVQLFGLRMAERNSGVSQEDRALLAELCGRLDCLPLAIELAVASCDMMSPGDLLRRLDGKIEVLAGGDRGAPPRHQSLAAALSWSFDLLPETERALLCRLAVFAGSFSLDDAEQVCAGDGFSGLAVLAGIAALVGKSLIGCQLNGSAVRYQLLRTVLTAVTSASWAQPELAAARARHTRWCTVMAEATTLAAGTGAELRSGLDRIEQYYGDMVAALSWCRSAATGSGLRLAVALGPFWLARGHLADGSSWFSDLIGEAKAGHSAADEDALPEAAPAAGRAWLEYGALLYARGELAHARACGEEAGRFFEAGPDPAGQRQALMLLSSVKAMTDPLASSKLLEEIRLNAADPAAWCSGIALALLGYAQTFTGDLAVARAGCLDCTEGAANPLVLLAGQIALGYILLDQGDFAAAGQALRHGRDLSRELRYPQGIALAMRGLGTAAAAVGRSADARACLAEAVAAARACAAPAVLASCLNEQARVLLDDEAAMSRSLCRQALAAAGAISAREVATALLGIGTADLAQGDVADGRVLAEEAAVVARRTGDKTVLARALYAEGRAAWLAGDLAAAWSLLRESLAMRAEAGMFPEVAESLEALAGVCAGQGQRREAGALFGAASGLRGRLGLALSAPARAAHDRDSALARAGSAAEFERGWARGTGQPEDIVAEVLSLQGRRTIATGWAALTRAEIEVARLAAEGLTNREIGARLFVSPRTVQTHLSHVFGKLKVTSRRELAREMSARTRSLGLTAEVPLRRVLGLALETSGTAGPAAPGDGWPPSGAAPADQ
jgi:predicted ATPase/DNA-binding CsgD family transcriptional regulator